MKTTQGPAAGLAVLALALASPQAARSAGMRPGSGPTRPVVTSLTCKLLNGAATSAPSGVPARLVQQVLVRSDAPETLSGTVIDYSVRLRNGQIFLLHRDDPPTLYAHQWVAVGEIADATFCDASLTRQVPVALGSPPPGGHR